MKTKKLLVSTLILATLGVTILHVSPVFAINRSTYSQGSTNDKKYGMGAYANQQAYAWLNTRWGERVIFFHGNNTVQTKHW